MMVKLVSFVLCPYVQRAVIALREKSVEYEVAYIDLAHPPEWFQAISPLGKVPLLEVEDQVLFESSVIIDYLDEVFQPRLHPMDPLRRAQHKAWIEFGSGLLVDQMELVLAQDETTFQERLTHLERQLKRLLAPLEAGVFDGDGVFSLLDAAYAPLFMRQELLAEIRVELAGLLPQPLQSWSDRLLARPSVKGSLVDDFRERYIAFFSAKGSWLMQQAGI
ncbi:glutathione S-transferase family protein [bacterium endosymbiont of Escarpia laminata]|nr:MAG: glutathione S-transferase family protein [bacterium endosymbiont of Escarpia laminata]